MLFRIWVHPRGMEHSCLVTIRSLVSLLNSKNLKDSRKIHRIIPQYARISTAGNWIDLTLKKHGANHFLRSMEHNTSIIDTPTICVSDPNDVSFWEWSYGLESNPKLTVGELFELSKVPVDAFQLVEGDITSLSGGIKELLGSEHPVLESCAKYFFDHDGGKKIRPTMVLAVSYALNGQQLSNTNINDKKLEEDTNESSGDDINKSSIVPPMQFASPSQKRLAEITEMIHTASLFHDDVIDKATSRRGHPSVNQVFGNKIAILGGDFLLSRASISLARLRNLEVVELLSTVIEHLVKGEIMQMKPSSSGNSELEYYLRKNYYKTASLMGHSCLAAAVLGGHSEECQRACYLYGTYVGQAFQLIDDALDFEGSTSSLGKAPLADLKSGLATAPTLFAAEEHPKLLSLMSRKFELPGDVDEALKLVQNSEGLRKCRELAQIHAEKAIESIKILGPSEARNALVALACKVITRTY
eukprot:gene12172-16300_t